MRSFWMLLLLCVQCMPRTTTQTLDVQGHRGARGLAPENTLVGFLLAADLGVTTIELDLVVSKDSMLVVSHEPYFSPTICLLPDGQDIPADSVINIYALTYNEISTYPCGMRQHPRFPEQQLSSQVKPLLTDVIDALEAHATTSGRPPLRYNIELKTTRETDQVYHPTPEQFSELVMDLLKEKEILQRVTLQSFDFRTLRYLHDAHPSAIAGRSHRK